MAILVTGGSGFLGSALIDKLLAEGNRVISVSRHAPQLRENMVPLVGDITVENLGLDNEILYAYSQGHIDSVYHLAGIVSLRQNDKDGSIWKTNVDGTKNVIDFCVRHQIPHLFFCSSAYTQGRNPYEKSKQAAELLVLESDIPSITIFKPSIILGGNQHFSQFFSLVVRVHRRADIIRRRLEGTLRLPLIEPNFRIKGNPEGKLNLIQVDQVVWGITNIEETGTFWLTHPDPPTLQQLVDWASEVIMVRTKFEPEFKPTPIEAAFQKMAAPFAPYLQGDNFPTNLHLSPPITREFIHETIKRTILD